MNLIPDDLNRYRNDPMFHRLVDSFYSLLKRKEPPFWTFQSLVDALEFAEYLTHTDFKVEEAAARSDNKPQADICPKCDGSGEANNPTYGCPLCKGTGKRSAVR